MQLQEFENHFTEVNTKLLLCIACLNPRESIHTFNKQKLICLTQFYLFNFFMVELVEVDNQLKTCILDMIFLL